MPKLQVNDGPHLVPNVTAHINITTLDATSTIEDELSAMVRTLVEMDGHTPDVFMSTCMALMARCTELWLQLVRIEGRHRKAKAIRTMQLQRVMDLIDFESKSASRLIEVRRQEIELSK